MLSPDTSALKARFASSNAAVEWCTLAVAIGVAVELVALLVFSKEMNRRERGLLIFASILIAGGVGGEYIFGSRATTAAMELQQISDGQVAVLNKEAENERLARVKIEERIAWRTLTDEQQRAIADKLRSRKGQPVNVFIWNTTAESLNLGTQIVAALKSAEWDVHPVTGIMLGVMVVGIRVTVNQSADDIAVKAAEELVVAIDAERLAIKGPTRVGPDSPGMAYSGELSNSAPIMVLVGVRG